MKEWKIRQEIYHRLVSDHGDDLNQQSIEMSSDIANTAIRYFYERDIGWIYPGKSYAVAVLYARWLSQDYNENFIQLLDDPDLLHGNDPYFVPYSQDPQNYVKIIAALPEDSSTGMIPDIRAYYEKEFLCNQE